MTGYVTCESDTYDQVDDCFDPKWIQEDFDDFMEGYQARYLGL